MRYMIRYRQGDYDFAPTIERAKELANSDRCGGSEIWDTNTIDADGGYPEESLVYVSPWKAEV